MMFINMFRTLVIPFHVHENYEPYQQIMLQASKPEYTSKYFFKWKSTPEWRTAMSMFHIYDSAGGILYTAYHTGHIRCVQSSHHMKIPPPSDTITISHSRHWLPQIIPTWLLWDYFGIICADYQNTKLKNAQIIKTYAKLLLLLSFPRVGSIGKESLVITCRGSISDRSWHGFWITNRSQRSVDYTVYISIL